MCATSQNSKIKTPERPNWRSFCVFTVNPFSANPTKWSNIKWPTPQSDHKPTNCLSIIDHFVGLAFKKLTFNIPRLFSCVFAANVEPVNFFWDRDRSSIVSINFDKI